MKSTIDDVINAIKSHGFVQVRIEDGRYYFTKGNVSLEYTTPCKDTADYHRMRCHSSIDITEWHDQMYICYYFNWTFESMFDRMDYLSEMSE